MGLLDRLRGGNRSPVPRSADGSSALRVVLGGQVGLEVVGESAYQRVLWRLCGKTVGERVRVPVVAVLVPEPANPYDPNAISVRIGGEVVGYLPRATARQYLPGLKRLMSLRGGYIALHGVIAGGGYHDDGPGRLGVWLDHDPADFRVRSASRPRPAVPAQPGANNGVRTGFTRARLTAAEEGSCGLSWYSDLPEADRRAIARLRQLLVAGSDPVDRHFLFTELEARLYRSRDLYESALAEYDKACARHDAEMDGIREALLDKWGAVPLLDTYRQMAIRQEKKKDWRACKWWAERGLALYGQCAAREDAVEDLIRRRDMAAAKLDTASTPRRQSQPKATVTSTWPEIPGPTAPNATLEVLDCRECGRRFERSRVRGRKPTLCPSCRTAAKR